MSIFVDEPRGSTAIYIRIQTRGLGFMITKSASDAITSCLTLMSLPVPNSAVWKFSNYSRDIVNLFKTKLLRIETFLTPKGRTMFWIIQVSSVSCPSPVLEGTATSTYGSSVWVPARSLNCSQPYPCQEHREASSPPQLHHWACTRSASELSAELFNPGCGRKLV